MEFHFKQFSLNQERSPMKVGTDGVLLGAWASCTHCRNALDVGTGTGLLSLMLAQKCEELNITAIEPNTDAFNEAFLNAQNSPWNKRITCLNESFQDHSPQAPYDLIISNPPFYEANTSIDGSGRMQARQSVHLPPEDLFSGISNWLAPDGKFQVIWPEETVRRFILQAAEYQLYLRKQLLIQPRSNQPVNRRIMEFHRHRGPIQQDTLALRIGKEMTPEYRELTSDFYLENT